MYIPLFGGKTIYENSKYWSTLEKYEWMISAEWSEDALCGCVIIKWHDIKKVLWIISPIIYG